MGVQDAPRRDRKAKEGYAGGEDSKTAEIAIYDFLNGVLYIKPQFKARSFSTGMTGLSFISTPIYRCFR